MAYRMTTVSPLLDALMRDAFNFTGPVQETAPQAWSPRVDLIESETAYLAQIELPGLKSDDFELTLDNRVLTLKGERKPPTLDEQAKRHLHERRAGAFERRFRFPVPVDASGIEATFEDGLLSVTVRKAPEAQSQKIQIKSKTA
ncbi:MAG: Hsp20/alpha crystallin family protein [Planctomycetota bacterium]